MSHTEQRPQRHPGFDPKPEDQHAENISRWMKISLFLLLPISFVLVVAPMAYLGWIADIDSDSMVIGPRYTPEADFAKLVPINAIGTLSKVEYIWSEGRHIRGAGIHASAYYQRPGIMASFLVLEDGTYVSAMGQVPDYGHGATVYRRETEDGLLSDFCIAHPVNDCFPPAVMTYRDRTPLTPWTPE